MKYRPHPTDDSLVIGDNGQIYAATRLPESHWAIAASWDILDMIPPGAIDLKWRLYLAGVIAGRLEMFANEGPPDGEHDTLRSAR